MGKGFAIDRAVEYVHKTFIILYYNVRIYTEKSLTK